MNLIIKPFFIIYFITCRKKSLNYPLWPIHEEVRHAVEKSQVRIPVLHWKIGVSDWHARACLTAYPKSTRSLFLRVSNQDAHCFFACQINTVTVFARVKSTRSQFLRVSNQHGHSICACQINTLTVFARVKSTRSQFLRVSLVIVFRPQPQFFLNQNQLPKNTLRQ